MIWLFLENFLTKIYRYFWTKLCKLKNLEIDYRIESLFFILEKFYIWKFKNESISRLMGIAVNLERITYIRTITYIRNDVIFLIIVNNQVN